MTVEDYTEPRSRGFDDPSWQRSDGALVIHPSFTLVEGGQIFASNDSGMVINDVFGALITVEENPPVEMGWSENTFEMAAMKGSYFLESPVSTYLSTQPQGISLRRPYIAQWYSDEDTITATASSFDHQGYHAGPSGTVWHHLVINSAITPTPGGPSSDLSDALFSAVIDPNFEVVFTTNDVQIFSAPSDVADVAAMHIRITCESAAGTFTVIDDVLYYPQTRQYSWTLDDMFRLGEAAGVDPDGGILRVYDTAIEPPLLMGTINPGWTSGFINRYERLVPIDSGMPKMASSSLNQVVLFDFEQGSITS